jgi:prophage tail gpP-like protein
MGDSEILLKVNGRVFTGWTDVQIEKSLMAVSGSFSLGATDVYPGAIKSLKISLGDACKVTVNNQIVIDGYIDEINVDYTDTSHNLQISGRDKTADLVDCSFTADVNEWKKQPISTVIPKLCEEVNVSVAIDSSVTTEVAEKLGTIKANEFDNISDLIKNICKVHGILMTTYGDGKLVLTRAGSERATDVLQLGSNVKSGQITQSNRDRFSTYIAKGQGVGSDNILDANNNSSLSGTATDPLITRNRPRVIFLEKAGQGEADYIKRAKWEARIQAGLSRSLSYKLQDWVQSNGKIWPLNALVQVKDSFLGIHSTLLISKIIFSLNDSGRLTQLDLVHPDMFAIDPFSTADVLSTQADWQSVAESKIQEQEDS